MESMLYQGRTFLGGIKHFWMVVRLWKTNLVLEDPARQKRKNMWPKWGLSWGLIDVWQNDRYYREVLERLRKRVHRVRPEIADTWMLHYDNAPVTLPPPWKNFLLVPQPPYSPHLSSYDIPFPEIQIPPQRSSFWNCGQYPKGRDRPAVGTSTWRLPALLPGVGATSAAVYDFPKELLWKG